MRIPARERGRFVSSWGLRKVVGYPSGRYEVIIVDNAGRPVSHLTEWYRLRKQPGGDGTRRTYLNFLMPFFAYVFKRGAAWNGEPEHIRSLVKAFLRDEVVCQVTPDMDADGYRIQLSGASSLAQSSLRVLCAALRDFYTVMADAGLYAYINPMRSELLIAWKREYLKQVRNAGAPEHAGIRGETQEESWKYPTAYFRQKRGLPWKPALALEPELALQRVRDAIASMIRQAKTQRDRVILMLLDYTGARLSEILGLTAGGYRKDKHPHRAKVTDKGSCGREEKTIYFTSAIERALIQYVRTERARHDPHGRKRIDQLADNEPLFLTRRGTAYRRGSFYYHWRIWLASVPPDKHTETLGPVTFAPHDIRHAYVTWIVRQMKQRYKKDAEKLSTLREVFQRRMAWRSQLTIKCYDHSDSEREKLEQFDEFLEELYRPAEVMDQPVHVPPVSSGDEKTAVHVERVQEALPAGSQTSSREGIALAEPEPVVHRDLSDLAFWKDDS
jgi:Phage integrase family